jgi:hypothetical protein
MHKFNASHSCNMPIGSRASSTIFLALRNAFISLARTTSRIQLRTMHLMLVVRCPNTDLEVSTGIIVDIKTFKELPPRPSKFRCSACDKEHIWSSADAMLADLSASQKASFVPPELDKR